MHKQNELHDVYVYSTPSWYEQRILLGLEPWIKIGRATDQTAETRVQQQDTTSNPEALKIMHISRECKTDDEIRAILVSRGYEYARTDKKREFLVMTLEQYLEELKTINEDSRPIKKYFEARPHQAWSTAITIDRWNEHLSSGSKISMIQPLEAAPRYGKLSGSYYTFKESGLPIMIVPSYVLTANSGYKKLLDVGYDITYDVTFIDTKDVDSVLKIQDVLARGGRVVLSVSLHDKADKINNELLNLLSNYSSFIHVEEADFGTTTDLVSERLFKYIYCSNNLVVPSTGTNIARAIRRYDNKTQLPIIVTYLDLLEAKEQRGYLFDNSYCGEGKLECSVLDDIRNNPIEWAKRLADLVTPACYTLQVSDDVVNHMNSLNDSQRPNMAKLFSAKNAHAMKSALVDMFMSDIGEDLFSLYFENYGYIPNAAAMMFVSGKKNVDAIVDCGNAYSAVNGFNYLFYPIHGDLTSNSEVERIVKNLVKEKKYDRIILVSCGMASRSFTIPEIIISCICNDGGRMEPAVQKGARAWSPSKEMKKTHGLVVKYAFNNECESHVEAYLVSSAIDSANGNLTNASRRLCGIIDFLKITNGTVNKVNNPDELAKLISTPTNLIRTAQCLTDFEGLLSGEDIVKMLSKILSSTKNMIDDKHKWKSSINKAKTYATNTIKNGGEISAEDAQLKDMRDKIYNILSNTGNLHYLAPECDSFETCMKAIANDPVKAYGYQNRLIGIPPDIVMEHFAPHLPIKILTLIIQGEIHHGNRKHFTNFDSPHKPGILKLKF